MFGLEIDRQQAISAVIAAATLLFLISVAPGARQRRWARVAAIVLYAVLFAGAVVWTVLWFFGIGG
jgi:hypothetical protein